jgi:hypothetical protein
MNVHLPLLRPVLLPLTDADIAALSVQSFEGRAGLTDVEVLTDLVRSLASRPPGYEVTRADIHHITESLIVIPEDTVRLFIRHFIKHYAVLVVPAAAANGAAIAATGANMDDPE